jgi:glycosyltransferase involved in cell wall biosynthesis
LATGADIIVKVDGDGQIDPALVPRLIELIRIGEADYVKGNRFYARQSVRGMPRARLVGNVALSFMTKLSSGYWRIFDPTNGFTAIHRHALSLLELSTLSRRYFFETDMLIQLGNIRAVVRDMPMTARYGDEESNLAVGSVLPEFFGKHLRAIVRRFVYWYFLRDFSLASVNALLGLLMLVSGGLFGAVTWVQGLGTGRLTPTGTIMLAALPVLLGTQLILNFLSYDISNEPSVPLQRFMPPLQGSASPVGELERATETFRAGS